MLHLFIILTALLSISNILLVFKVISCRASLIKTSTLLYSTINERDAYKESLIQLNRQSTKSKDLVDCIANEGKIVTVISNNMEYYGITKTDLNSLNTYIQCPGLLGDNVTMKLEDFIMKYRCIYVEEV